MFLFSVFGCKIRKKQTVFDVQIFLIYVFSKKKCCKSSDLQHFFIFFTLIGAIRGTWRSNPGNLFATVSLRQILLSRMNGAHELCAAIPFINKKQLIV